MKEQGAEGGGAAEIPLFGVGALELLVGRVREQRRLDALVVEPGDAGVRLDQKAPAAEVRVGPDALLRVVVLVVDQRRDRRGRAGDDGDVPGPQAGLEQGGLGVGPADDEDRVLGHAETAPQLRQDGARDAARRGERGEQGGVDAVNGAEEVRPVPGPQIVELGLAGLRGLEDRHAGKEAADPAAEREHRPGALTQLRTLQPQAQELGRAAVLGDPLAGHLIEPLLVPDAVHELPAAVVDVRQTVKGLPAPVEQDDALPRAGGGDGVRPDPGAAGVHLLTAAQQLLLPLLREEVLRVGVGLVAVIAVDKAAHGEDLPVGAHEGGAGAARAEVDQQIVLHAFSTSRL